MGLEGKFADGYGMIWWCLVMFQVKATSFVLWEPQSISHFDADRMHRTIWWNLDDPSLNFARITDVSRNAHLQTDKPNNKPLLEIVYAIYFW